MSEYTKKRGDRVGLNWRIPTVKGKRSIRHVVYDTNFWKSFVHQRLAVGMFAAPQRADLRFVGDGPDRFGRTSCSIWTRQLRSNGHPGHRFVAVAAADIAGPPPRTGRIPRSHHRVIPTTPSP